MRGHLGERGYAMAALLVAMSIMSIMLGIALPVWRTAVQREREAELVFRGEQYAHAIEIFQRRTGGYPQTLDQLEKTRAIRRLYKDPITGGDFQPVFVGQMIGGAPVALGQAGRAGAVGQAGRGAGAQPSAAGRGGGGVTAGPAGRGQPAARGTGPSGFTGGGVGQAGFGTPPTPTAGPIIGVVSRSSAQALRLYNGRGKYNEWAFVATATTQQAGAPTGAQTPGMPPGRGRGGQQNPFGPGGQQGPLGGRGGQQNPGGRGGQQNPGRGLQFPGRGIQPPAGGGGRGLQPGTGFPVPGPGTTNPQR